MAKIIQFNNHSKKKKHTTTTRRPYNHTAYKPSSKCTNNETYGCVCVHCGRCGRKFINGILQE